MLKATAKVCAILLVIICLCEQCCYSLEIYYEHEVNNELRNDEDLIAPETINYIGKFYEEPVTEIPKQPEGVFKLLFGDNRHQDENDIEYGSKDAEITVKSRVVRQAYSGSAPLYPKLPSGSPYNQYQQYNNQNSQWQPPNNFSQQGYSKNGGSNFYSSTQQNSSYGHQPYYPSQGQNPYNNNNFASSYPGYRPPNSTVYNSGSSQPSYNSLGQFNSNPYNGYPTQTPGYRPINTVTSYNSSQRPTYFPVTSNNVHPNTYTTNRSPYSNHNTSNWSGTSIRPPYNSQNGQNPQYFNPNPNNPYRQPNSTFPQNLPNQGSYPNPSNGYPINNNYNLAPYSSQKPQSFNSYSQGQNQNPYNNRPNGQYAGGNNYPGNSYGSDTFNLANGYNPSVPNQPPYGTNVSGQNGLRYTPGSNGVGHDPTKVSPEHFSYPH